MSEQVSVEVKSELLKLVDDLNKIQKAQDSLAASLKETTESVGKSVGDQTKKVESGFDKLKGMGRRLADQLRKDFNVLGSLGALKGAMSMGDQMVQTVKETVSLSDSIRKLGSVFQIPTREYEKFQNKMTKGMGEIGLSSEAASNTLQGLAEIPVRGQENLLGYSKAAGELASIGNQRGKEGDIAGGIGRLIQARGGNVNDMGQVSSIAEDVRRARNATGKGPAEIIRSMESLYTGMSDDFRKKISTRGLTNLAAAGNVAGPQATTFIQEFLKLSKTQRAGMEARGVGGVFGENGVNTGQVAKLFAEAKKLGGGDARLGVKAATGIDSDEAAEGFIRLAESLERVKAAQDGVTSATGDLEGQYRQSMGLTESLSANYNRVKAFFSAPLSGATQATTNILSETAQSNTGAAGATAGAAGVSATLAGAGIRGVLGGGAAAGGIGFLPGAIAAGVGSTAGDLIKSSTPGEDLGSMTGVDAIKELGRKLDNLGGGGVPHSNKNFPLPAEMKVKVGVELQSGGLMKTQPPGRGTAN